MLAYELELDSDLLQRTQFRKVTNGHPKDKKDKNVFPVTVVKAYRGSKGIAPLILKLRTSLTRVINLTQRLFLQEATPVPIE
jgi:hypothetical protein